MSAIANFPFYNRPTKTKARTLTTTASPRMVLMADTANAPDESKKTTGAGVTGIDGVICTPQGDPNNSGDFAIGAVVDVAEEGTVPVLFEANAVIAREATIIASATAGCAKVLAAEGKPYDVIGYAAEAKTIGASPDVAAVRLNIHRVEA